MLKSLSLILLVASTLSQMDYTGLSEGSKAILDQVSQTELGATIILELQVELKTDEKDISQGDRGLASMIVLFNSLEKDLVQEDSEDSDKLQINQDKERQQQQQVSDDILEARGKISSFGNLVTQISESSSHFTTRKNEKDDLQSEYVKLLESLSQMRRDENDHYNSNKDELLNTAEIVKRAKFLMSEMIPQMPKSTILVQNNYRDYKNSDNDQMGDYQSYIEQLQKNGNNNPYVRLISSLIQVQGETLASPKKEEIEAALEILRKLQNDLMDSYSALFKADQQREKNFKDVTERCENEIQNWKQETADIQKLIEEGIMKSKDYSVLKGQQQEQLQNLEKLHEDLQRMMEDEKVDYKLRRQDREKQLKTIRQIRTLLEDDFVGVKQYILTKVKNLNVRQ